VKRSLLPARGRASLVANMAATSTVTTAEQLLRMPDDGMRHELVSGELRVMSPAGFRHGRLAGTIATLLGTHVRESGCGVILGAATGFVISRDPDTVRAPDAAFVSEERFESVGETEKFWPGAPDLAVEVLSPSDTFHEVQEKALEWISAGSVAVLVIDPEKRIATVYRSGGQARIYGEDETLELGDAVPAFSVAVSGLFG
jgi:Uma2 family endonuclease